MNDGELIEDLTKQCESLALTAEIESALVNVEVNEVAAMPFVTASVGYLVGSLLQKRPFSAKAMEKLMIEKLWNPLHEI